VKHVPPLTAEPPSLAAYRASNPADAAAPGTMAAAVWSRFRDDPAYRVARAQLLERQQGLCGYCEQRLTSDTGELNMLDQQIEHVLSKSGAAGRTLDWKNFMLCCGGGTRAPRVAGQNNVSCGQFKGDGDLGPGCDPRTFPCTPKLIDVGLDGKLSANRAACAAAGRDPLELERTLNEVLNLNCERLRSAREKVIDNLLNWQVPLLKTQLEGSHLRADQVAEFQQLLVAGRLQPDSHGHLRAFWTTERHYLDPWSSEWIARNEPLLSCAAASVQGAS
jgi:uncharacterized protein (TIGR02646 family)